MTNYFRYSVSDIAQAIKTKKITSIDFMESLISRVDSRESELNVWANFDKENALFLAHKAHKKFLKDPNSVGSLHGVPFGVKDIFFTKGIRTECGSKIFKGFIPDYNSEAVSKLQRSGAINIGKTVTTEFAGFDPSITCNPWNTNHTPGGSSSGSAVGVSVGMIPFSLGSQTGGSVLRPASYNGVVGFKPTYGLISTFGVMPLAWSLDTVGTFSKYAKDLPLLLDVLSGYDSRDKGSVKISRKKYLFQKNLQKSPKIGVLRSHFFEKANKDVVENVDLAINKFKKSGAEIVDFRVDFSYEDVLNMHKVLMYVEGASVHQKNYQKRPDDFGQKISESIETGLMTSAVEYIKAQKFRKFVKGQLIEKMIDFDFVLTPSTPTAATDFSTTGDASFQSPWTYVGFPTITIPSGLDNDRLPLGIQIIGIPFSDGSLISNAIWCEDLLQKDLFLEFEKY